MISRVRAPSHCQMGIPPTILAITHIYIYTRHACLHIQGRLTARRQVLTLSRVKEVGGKVRELSKNLTCLPGHILSPRLQTQGEKGLFGHTGTKVRSIQSPGSILNFNESVSKLAKPPNNDSGQTVTFSEAIRNMPIGTTRNIIVLL
jgi:hypothetical protein